MKHSGLLWLVAALLAVGAIPALADDDGDGEARLRVKKAKRVKAERSNLRGEYAKLASVTGFSDEQRAKFVERLKAHQQAQAEWKKEHGKQFKALNKDLREARKAKNAEKVKDLAKQLSDLKAEQKKRNEQLWDDIHGMMTDEQKQTWQQQKFYEQALRPFGRAKLTDDQKARVKELAAAAMPAYQAAEGKKKAKVAAELRDKIRDEVLNDDQRARLQRKGPKGQKGDKAEKPKRQPKAKGGKQRAPHEDEINADEGADTEEAPEDREDGM